MQTGTPHSNNKFKTGLIFLLLMAGCLFLVFVSSAQSKAAVPSPSTWFVDMGRYAAAAHGTLKCEDCHGPMGVKGKAHPDPEGALLKTRAQQHFDYQSCKKCHQSAHDRSQKGEHAKALAKERTEGKPSKTGVAPTCGACHSAHYARAHSPRALVGKEMTQTCGTCHPDQKTSFLANYHGKAGVNLGYEKSAFCTDCHGAHTTLSLKDKQLALTACRRCHFDATPEFANIIIHDTTKNIELKSEAKQSGLKWVHWTATLSLLFVVALLAFFYTHSGLLMLRNLHKKLRKHK